MAPRTRHRPLPPLMLLLCVAGAACGPSVTKASSNPFHREMEPRQERQSSDSVHNEGGFVDDEESSDDDEYGDDESSNDELGSDDWDDGSDIDYGDDDDDGLGDGDFDDSGYGDDDDDDYE